MTVNLGLITSDALVLGCDSVASTSKHYLDPFSVRWEEGPDGELLRDEDGRFTLKFSHGDLRQIVTSAWGSVTKMFQIHPDPSPVVAITAGQAKLQDRSIASHADEFFQKQRRAWGLEGEKGDAPRRLVNVEPICRAFLRFMRDRYGANYKDSPIPNELRPELDFLLGGFGRDDTFPSLYRVSVKDDELKCAFAGGSCGVSWNGQADAVERFIRGYDNALRARIQAEVVRAFEEYEGETHTYLTELVNSILDELGTELPEEVEIEAPKMDEIKLSWEEFAVPIDYRNLPLQEAVNFVSAMVMAQASRARFAMGVPTVGGRIHVGIITKADGFRALNEPDIVHKFTGLSHDV